MKIALMLVAVTLVSASSISPYSKLNYSKQRSISAVLTEVEAKLQNNSPLNSILNVLKQFKDAVNVEQVNHDEIYHLQDNECYSEFDFRSKEVEDASNVVRDSTAHLNVCKTSKIRTTNQQDVNQQQLFTYQEHLTLILATAESEQGYFKKRGRDYEDSLHAIDEALDILSGIANGKRSFAELSSVSKSMLQTSFNIQKTFNYAPIFYAFSQLASQQDLVDPSQIERVEQLLLQLRESIHDTYNEFTASNAASVAAFNDQKDRINSILNRLANQEERLQDKLDHLNQCIGTQSAIVQAASTKLERNQQLWDQAVALCNTFEIEYYSATRARRSELSLITELEDHVNERFGQVKQKKPHKLLRYAKLKY
ncbi:unnamed protein product (macronuclear) [Paramecium tetraurelia]|uniref:Trichocyst matrix protein n=1 Tax=Paramecium tetraurelia TaxID=5888 RepID=A0BZX9_PARTE|nr:uncharacterized protein GSPATT00005948001 [Paramecium tetraurelia]CAK64096.1 unnamed protein product [Paramecium tetraurelia]|eukprot:XP_001431494.1 hypothetical protein (macronuclear) [Paramecium tetraurelia strain d4-2]